MKDNYCHPSNETIENWILDRVPEPEASTVEEHLLVCSRCIIDASMLEEEIWMLRCAAR